MRLPIDFAKPNSCRRNLVERVRDAVLRALFVRSGR